jgi:uncharacterized protein DUF3147
MAIRINLRALRKTKWNEYALRFLFGGTITVVTGVLAHLYGPEFAGLFLAFPAIFPASATLISKHEREAESAPNLKEARGRAAAALDARGVMMGSVGLAAFALTVWKLLPNWNGVLTLLIAFVIWLVLSIFIWHMGKAVCRGHVGAQ